MDYHALFRMKVISLLAILMLLAALNTVSFAANTPPLPPGTPFGGCWADPMNNLQITLSASSFVSNKAGAEGYVRFQTHPHIYDGWCYAREEGSASYFRSTVAQPEISPGWFKLNESVAYHVQIVLAASSPFSPFSNVVDRYASVGPSGPGITSLNGAGIGNNGVVYFKLTKDIIGGGLLVPAGVELANLYRYVYKGSWAPVPIYRLITTTSIVPIPVECRINSGTVINVPFGSIDSSLVTTNAATTPYKIPAALNYKCNTSLTQDIKVNLIADSTDFSSDAIKTSNKDIGVVMQHNGVAVPPQGAFASKIINGLGSDNVTFNAIKRPGEITQTGPFTGSAVLLISTL